jgi:hypothetical protein
MIKEGYEGLNNSVYLEQGTRMQVESTTRCNCMCPGCARTKIMAKYKSGESSIMYDITDMSLQDFKHLVRPENKIHRLTFSLVLGDPIYSGVFLQQLEHLNSLEKRPWINIHTNGSGRTKEWWYHLGSILKGRDRCEFAIDGLEDTNPIYRVNSKWNTIIEGMKTLKQSLLDHNSDAEIDLRHIIFEHNYHQTLDMCKFAQEQDVHTLRIFIGDGRTPKHMQLKSKEWTVIQKEVDDYFSKV